MRAEPLTRITDYVDYYAQHTPAAEAMVFEENRTTYAQLKQLVDQCARALMALGVGAGDRVALLCTSRAEYWITFNAVAGLGAIWLGLDPKFKLEELSYLVKDSEPRVLFCQSNFEDRNYQEILDALVKGQSSIQHSVSIGAPLVNTLSWSEFLEKHITIDSASYQALCDAVVPISPAMLVYTSGTTGKPKGAVLSHAGLTQGATMQSRHILVETPSIVCNFPINHVACVADTCATTLVKGGKIVFQQRFDAGQTLAALEREKCTVWGGVPTMVQLQLAHPAFETTDLSSVQVVMWGGAAMPKSAIEQLQEKGFRLLSVYGMTETSAHVTYTEEGADVDVLAETVGKPDPECPCRIVREDLSECAPGETGELQFKGDLMLLEYWRLPQATTATFTTDGWLKTGDTACWRADGNIQIVGRMSEMFKSGGYNVYPREVEQVLESHPDIEICAVISVKDALYQEVGHAYVADPDNKLSEKELKIYCLERLANYKVPKRFFIEQELPMLPVGKIDKKKLQTRSAQGA